jgi:hypothetical protein
LGTTVRQFQTAPILGTLLHRRFQRLRRQARVARGLDEA